MTNINRPSLPIEPIEVMIRVQTRGCSGTSWAAGVRTNIPESLISRIGTKHTIPDGCKVGECYVQAVGRSGVKLDKPVKNGLKPCVAACVMATASIDISHEKVVCVDWGLGEKGDLT